MKQKNLFFSLIIFSFWTNFLITGDTKVSHKKPIIVFLREFLEKDDAQLSPLSSPERPPLPLLVLKSSSNQSSPARKLSHQSSSGELQSGPLKTPEGFWKAQQEDVEDENWQLVNFLDVVELFDEELGCPSSDEE